ncbi:MAG: hypothetical protein V4556_02805 [Bacteroidota bacterium]
MKPFHKIIISFTLIFALLTIISCNENSFSKVDTQQEDIPETKTISDGNISITTSTDINRLEQFLELDKFHPTSVKFQHTVIENYGYETEYTTAVKPDYDIEAVLNFDSSTFAKFMHAYSRADWVSPKYNKREFEFPWLDEKTKKEIAASDPNYHGHIDLFFTYNDPNCRLWILNQKVLLHWFTR